ncbi:peptidoglycan DD-metalloendopeptidase family protein [Stenotrophomonas sp. SRS1]|uniref:M23/M56 family metallopeptidase n=1 Tax=Stenotrophomonas sp. SRS1 TaxID=2870345 RepID=UPI0022371E39|nr:M23/M56 family metallopeptidase [Stenotrophomonas sp. SRS1]MCW6028559.1 peptidoglycan DD-metalloendopeptidase family protein [Stenotrophomonas sp. SRS1]
MSLPTLGFWVVHAAGALAGGGLAWAAGQRLHRWLGLSHAAYGYWMGLWLLAVMPVLLSAAVALWAPAPLVALPAALIMPLPVALDLGDAGAAGVAHVAAAWAPPSAATWLAVLYAIGAGVALLRVLVGTRRTGQLCRATTPITTAAWPGPRSRAAARRLLAAGITCRGSVLPVSPFAVRWPQPLIVLPASALDQLDDRALCLILGHEAAHLARRDPQRAGLMAVFNALLWFNPFLLRISARVQLATELRCDAHALAEDVHGGRDFAAAYVRTLRLTAATHTPSTALTHRDLAGHEVRIRHMLHGDGARPLSGPRRVLLLGSTLLTGGLLLVMQASTARPLREAAVGADPIRVATTVTALPLPPVRDTPAGVRFQAPLAAPRITSPFGDTGSIRQRAHRGTDFGARPGTPVLAPADGRIVAATTAYPDGPQYGTVVVIDHGQGWQTLYAHLQGVDVAVGQQVHAGEQIARVGSTGRVTGPHLHLEMLRDGERVDPQAYLP